MNLRTIFEADIVLMQCECICCFSFKNAAVRDSYAFLQGNFAEVCRLNASCRTPQPTMR